MISRTLVISIYLLAWSTTQASFQPTAVRSLPLCEAHVQIMGEEWFKSQLKTFPKQFSTFMRYDMFWPEDFKGMAPNPRSDWILVDRYGTAFQPKDLVLYGDDDRVKASIEILTEQSEVKDQFGKEVLLSSTNFAKKYQGITYIDGKAYFQVEKLGLRSRKVMSFADVRIVRPGLIDARPIDMILPGVLNYFKTQNLRGLADQYYGDRLPEAAYFDIEAQEFFLADYRTFEVFILFGDILAAYLRFYDCTKTIPDEIERYQGAQPVTRAFYMGQHLQDIPTYLMPMERILRFPDGDENPINRMRNDPRYEGYRFLEVGRAMVNYRQLSPLQAEEAKKHLLTTAYHLVGDLAPDGKRSKVLMFSTGKASNSRHYESEHGFSKMPQGKITPDMMKSIHDQVILINGLPFRLQIAGRKYADPSFIRETEKKLGNVYVLHTAGDRWSDRLIEKGWVLPSAPTAKWNLYPDEDDMWKTQFWTGNPFRH